MDDIRKPPFTEAEKKEITETILSKVRPGCPTSRIDSEAPVPGAIPQNDPIMQYFTYKHLPDGLMRNVSRQCSMLSAMMNESLPEGPEKRAGMRKLLEAKDCFVRAALEGKK